MKKYQIMKKLILLLFLAFSFTISSAQTLNSFTITDPINCFGETGELTASVSGGTYLHLLHLSSPKPPIKSLQFDYFLKECAFF